MKTKQVIRAKLETRTDADCSTDEVKNNKVHYHLKYESSRGWDWLEKQVYKTSKDTDIDLELHKINTSGVSAFEVEVRELTQREGITDENQRDFTEF